MMKGEMDREGERELEIQGGREKVTHTHTQKRGEKLRDRPIDNYICYSHRPLIISFNRLTLLLSLFSILLSANESSCCRIFLLWASREYCLAHGQPCIIYRMVRCD
jgi:hypothetical protein